jgi:hypothetical protein
MDEQLARAKIRALMTAGTLPAEPSAVTSIAHSRIAPAQDPDDPCLVYSGSTTLPTAL